MVNFEIRLRRTKPTLRRVRHGTSCIPPGRTFPGRRSQGPGRSFASNGIVNSRELRRTCRKNALCSSGRRTKCRNRAHRPGRRGRGSPSISVRSTRPNGSLKVRLLCVASTVLNAVTIKVLVHVNDCLVNNFFRLIVVTCFRLRATRLIQLPIIRTVRRVRINGRR